MQNPLFSPKQVREILKNYLPDKDIPNYAHKVKTIEEWQNDIQNGRILKAKEEAERGRFLRFFFETVLEYPRSGDTWQLEDEQKTHIDSTKPDAVLGFFKMTEGEKKGDIRAVIELKDARTNLDKPQNRSDLKGSPVQQAFGYAPKMGGNCKWVIVSDFLEIRLYWQGDMNKYERFIIADLLKTEHDITHFQLRKLHFLLACRRFFAEDKGNSTTEQLFENRLSQEAKIEKDFYVEYDQVRRAVVQMLIQLNPQQNPLNLLTITQLLIDRLIFICFAKDYWLISARVFDELQNVAKLTYKPIENPLWEELLALFGAMDYGIKDRVPPFNGGLFRQNPLLEQIKVKDSVVEKLLQLTRYDYESDLPINILGHIFEQSITDLEELKKQIEAQTSLGTEGKEWQNLGEKTGKRKRDGIYYTPAYITQYIVEEAVGGWLNEHKDRLGINQIAEPAQTPSERAEQLKKWEEYRAILLNIKVLDPACGSGAFLNQVFDYLYREWTQILKPEMRRLRESAPNSNGKSQTTALSFGDSDEDADWIIRKRIISRNIFGVDLNPESVEITRLSLWLKTASKREPLANLDKNIQVGNSLIDDPALAGDLAFDWQTAFAEIMQAGGFDVVVGNPPYGAILSNQEQKFIVAQYQKHNINPSFSDTYVFFYLLGVFTLLKDQGILGFITPNTWRLVESGLNFRKTLLSNAKFLKIIQHLEKIFPDATVDCDTLILKKDNHTPHNYPIHLIVKNQEKIIKNNFVQFETLHSQNYINLYLDDKIYQLIDKIKTNSLLIKDYFEIKNGVKPYEVGKGSPPQTAQILAEKPFTSHIKKDSSFVPLIGGSLFHRYQLFWQNDSWISYGEWLAAPREKLIFEKPEKLIFRQTADSIIGTYITSPFVMRDNTHIILSKDDRFSLKYILALLNSKLNNFLYWTINPEKGEALAQVKLFHLGLLTFMDIGKNEQQPFIQKVDILLQAQAESQALQKDYWQLLPTEHRPAKINTKLEKWYLLDFQSFISEVDKTKPLKAMANLDFALLRKLKQDFEQAQKMVLDLEHQFQTTDNALNEMVFDLYGLNSTEKKLIQELS
ncbi:MAG: BREX-1 system adenine-specific DNA-methyltransferase PglX [Microscillaceae bacterium]|jgi:hypothetical protein|nr:BREX-1 system adenine-specific DNA-methyltransferase PglX [Microscillaceae bacterium]